MPPERFKQIEQCYLAALERSPESRAAFLLEACGEDIELREEVQSLLAHGEDTLRLLETGAWSQETAPATTLTGRQFVSYRILSRLGAGGMGEVYRAHDNKLGRDVAIKTLPRQFARHPERLARFRREARMLASLNHPNIAAIYGIEESGGVDCLVLELVEGETLRGPLSVETALLYARQIAEALEAAHGRGIVHRDLKPANVKVTPEGRVKVLDFGLAKAVWGEAEIQDLSQTPMAGGLETLAGQVLGTPPYMSPEQARGQEVDKRTDIWAFGCLLYELLAGRRAFRGETLSETVTGILEREPDWEALDAATPGKIRELMRNCLEKDASHRLEDIRDARLTIEAVTAKPRVKRWQGISAALALAILVSGSILWMRGPSRQAAFLLHATFTQLTDQPGRETYPSLASDGKSFVYASRAAGKWDIYTQRVGGKNPTNLTRDSGADNTQPAFSPDGERIAFRSERGGGGIFLMGATGENVKRVTDSGYDPAWSPDGSEIVYGSSTSDMRHQLPSQLLTVNLSTGEKRVITSQTDYSMQPHWSPHGYRIACWRLVGGQRHVWTIPARGGSPVAVTNGDAVDWNPVWSPDGVHLYFVSDRGGSMNLWRTRIDEKSGKVIGEPEPVTTPSPYSAYISFARTGRQLGYMQQTRTSNLYRIAFDPSREVTVGQPLPVTQGSRDVLTPALSPDGDWLAFSTTGKRQNLFVVRKDGTGLRQLTDGDYSDRVPAWSPDGQRLAFYSNRSGKFDIWTIFPDGSGLQQLTFTPDGFVVYPVWAPDGKRMIYTIQNRNPFLFELGKPWRGQSPQSLPPMSEPGMWFAAQSWSPDGRKLAGIQIRGDGTFMGINVYSVDSRRHNRLTEFGWFPAWLSDSRRLVFHNEADSKIYLVDSQTREVHEIFSAAPNDAGQGSPISPDDRWIYFTAATTESDVWLASFE
jgi:Tol biopolymer transport system component/tRNA A-37 threonylcarbamoyl transferase component Bud32